MDLDGTLTQHKSKLEPACRDMLYELKRQYKLLMVCAGGCERVCKQMEGFPIDIIGFYGMQVSTINSGRLEITENHTTHTNKESVSRRINMLREELGFTQYYGDSVEFHNSGIVTFPILGTAAVLQEKLSFDPDRKKRRSHYLKVKEMFEDYTVFIGGSSSFDMAPPPFCKLYALNKYLRDNQIDPADVAFFGDDYGLGGNDEDIYKSDIDFFPIDDYTSFPEAVRKLHRR